MEFVKTIRNKAALCVGLKYKPRLCLEFYIDHCNNSYKDWYLKFNLFGFSVSIEFYTYDDGDDDEDACI